MEEGSSVAESAGEGLRPFASDGSCKSKGPTVAEAERLVAELTGDAAKVSILVSACLNAQATLHMLGYRAPKRRPHFLPLGVQTLVHIEDLLATMPEEVALAKASMAFACDYWGMPAETGTDDGWICDTCYAQAISPTPRSTK